MSGFQDEPPAAATDADEQIYAVLIAVIGDTLLVPNRAVAEAVPRDGLQPVDGPAWLLGIVNWGGRRVPVIRFETLNGGGPQTMPGRRDRILVMQAAGDRLSSGLFGIVAEGYPHLVSLNRAAIVAAPLRPNDRAPLIAARARIANQEVLIPDFDAVELELAQALESLSL